MINFLNKGGVNTKDADANSEDIIYPKTAYVNGEKVEGSIMPIYGEVSPNIVLSDKKLSSNNMMTMGFSLDNKLAFQLNYDTQELIVYDNSNDNLIELKREPLSSFIDVTIEYHKFNSIIISQFGASEDPECVHVGISIYPNNSFITVLHVPTLTFNYATNGYPEKWVNTPGYDNTIIHFFDDNPNRFYSVIYKNAPRYSSEIDICVLNKNGNLGQWKERYLFNSAFPIMMSYCCNKKFINMNFCDANGVDPKWIAKPYIYKCYGNEDKSRRIKEDMIFSINGNYATDGTSIYSTSIDYETDNITKTKLFDLDIPYSKILFFITNDIFVVLPEDSNDFSKFIFVIIDYDNEDVSEITIELDESISYNSLAIDNILNAVTSNFRTIGVETSLKLDGLIKHGNKYYNSSNANATESNLLYKKVAYNNTGKIRGTMPNNGELNYTPSNKEQIIPEGYTSGGIVSAVTSDIDSNIIPENIKEGVTILGVTGTYTGETTPDQEVV